MKKYTLPDWALAIIGFVIVALLCLGFKRCAPEPAVVNNAPIKEEVNANNAQKAYDVLLIFSAHQVDSLESIITHSKTKSTKIKDRYITLHDTIFLTPADSQQRITKMLCSATGDSVNLQEINYCLASRKQAEDLYKESITQLGAKDKQLSVKDTVIAEGQKNMASKDSLNVAQREINTTLDKSLQKQTKKASVWRNVSIILIAILIPIIVL